MLIASRTPTVAISRVSALRRLPQTEGPSLSGARSSMTGVSTPAAALDVLRLTFGYDAFRGDQEQIVDHVIGGVDGMRAHSFGELRGVVEPERLVVDPRVEDDLAQRPQPAEPFPAQRCGRQDHLLGHRVPLSECGAPSPACASSPTCASVGNSTVTVAFAITASS